MRIDSNEFLMILKPFLDMDFKIEWYYIGEGYDPTWFRLKDVKKWKNG